MSKSGGGVGPFRRFDPDLAFPADVVDMSGELSTDVVEALASVCFSRAMEPFRRSLRFDESAEVNGRTSFFCFDAGRISSRSTGTPRDTKKSRLIRDRVQLGGCKGGGSTSCVQSDKERSVRKTELESFGA